MTDSYKVAHAVA